MTTAHAAPTDYDRDVGSIVRGALLALQLALTVAPGLVLLMVLAFDDEAHRGNGSDISPLFHVLAWAAAVAPLLVWGWIVWKNGHSAIPAATFRFWLPSVAAAFALAGVVGATTLGAAAQARQAQNERRARMAQVQAEVDRGDLTHSCELVALRTRDNLRESTLTYARETDITACLHYAGSLSSADERARNLDEAFVLAGRFLEINAQAASLPIDEWSSPPPPFPAATHVAITRAYWSTFLARPTSLTGSGVLLDLTAKVNQMKNWDPAAQDLFHQMYVPALLSLLEAAPADENTPLRTSLRALLRSFPKDPD